MRCFSRRTKIISIPSETITFIFPSIAPAPSASGYQLSLHGALGVLAAWDEGIEINLFGLVWGIDPADLAIKWPGVGRLGFDTPWPTQRGLNSVGTP